MGTLNPATIGLLVFVAFLGVSLSSFYFLVEAPAARRGRRARLAAMERTYVAEQQQEPTSLRARLRKPVSAASFRLPGAEWLDRRLEQAGMLTSAEAIQMIGMGGATLGFLVGVAAGQPAGGVLLLSLCAGGAPLAAIEFRRSRRLSAFEEQFPDAIDLLGRAVRAGHAFTTGFELISKEMPEPVAGEFHVAYEQQNLGLPLRDALAALASRVPTADVKIFVSALQIQRETGGNLAEILDKLSLVIRERFKLRRQIKVFTAEGRMSLYVLTATPLATAVLLYFVNKSYIVPLLNDPTGLKMTWTGAALVVMGYFVIRRMTNVKV